MTFNSETTKELQAKLNPAHVKPPRQYGPKGDYIEGWHAIAEANRIFGFDAWSYDIMDMRCVAEKPRDIGQGKKPGFGVSYIARVRVVVGGVTRDDVGAGHGYDIDLGLAHESAIKEAVTDALKRSLRTFGNPFGLALYDKTRENVGIDAPPPEPQPSDFDRLIAMISKATTAGELMEWLARPRVLEVIDTLNDEERMEITKAKSRRVDQLDQAAS